MSNRSQTYLFQHGVISVTRSWISINQSRYAVRYVDQTSVTSTKLPRGSAMGAMAVCFLLALYIAFRMVAGDFTAGFGRLFLFGCAIVMLAAGYVAFVMKDVYTISIRFQNGETVSTKTEHGSRARLFESAIHDALDQLDYHDTDDVKPSVVVATLDPVKVHPVSGPAPETVDIYGPEGGFDDDVYADGDSENHDGGHNRNDT